ncbi:hypothetical protein ALCH109712_09965 [Alkalicoccus chagannorensis]
MAGFWRESTRLRAYLDVPLASYGGVDAVWRAFSPGRQAFSAGRRGLRGRATGFACRVDTVSAGPEAKAKNRPPLLGVKKDSMECSCFLVESRRRRLTGKRVASRKKGDACLPEAGGYQTQAGRSEGKRSHLLHIEPANAQNTPLLGCFGTVRLEIWATPPKT